MGGKNCKTKSVDGPLATAYSAGAAMTLLLLHFFEDSFFLYFDEITSLFFPEAEPKLLYTLPFLC
jgi:hypothetical protein